jgi:hypothetical protein
MIERRSIYTYIPIHIIGSNAREQIMADFGRPIPINSLWKPLKGFEPTFWGATRTRTPIFR